jgi:hypothetical protein
MMMTGMVANLHERNKYCTLQVRSSFARERKTEKIIVSELLRHRTLVLDYRYCSPV